MSTFSSVLREAHYSELLSVYIRAWVLSLFYHSFIIVLSSVLSFFHSHQICDMCPVCGVYGGVYGGVYSIRYTGHAPMAQGEWGEFTRPKKICLRGEHTSVLLRSNNTMILL
jgi:hypothetical protein